MSVGLGLGVLHEPMEAEVDEVVGPKGKHDPQRSAKREEGLRGPVRRRRKRAVGDGPSGRELVVSAPDDVWALDFQADQAACGRLLRLVNILDEHTRQALVMHAGRSMNADETVAQLEALVAARGGASRFLRADTARS